MSEPKVEPFSTEAKASAHPRYKAMRRTAPVHSITTPQGSDAWLIVGYDEAAPALTDPRLSRVGHQETGTAVGWGTTAEPARSIVEAEACVVTVPAPQVPGIVPGLSAAQRGSSSLAASTPKGASNWPATTSRSARRTPAWPPVNAPPNASPRRSGQAPSPARTAVRADQRSAEASRRGVTWRTPPSPPAG
ncbi:hypothetical protein [Streptomyces sirii]|uniref:hypothetical protein n=1 Tax=Streptomyces sirii TaxID=3127701 RepID=UPI003D365296